MGITKQQWVDITGGFPPQNLLFTQLNTLPKPGVVYPRDRIIFDIETELISKKFRYAKGTAQKIRQAPEPKIACAYSVEKKRYLFFKTNEFNDFYRLLSSASMVVTFNGEAFDFFVIAKQLGLNSQQLKKINSVDLFSIIFKAVGRRVSLNNLSIVNLNEKKRMFGDTIPNQNIAVIKEACRSDVSQTNRLFRLYEHGSLKVPMVGLTRKNYKELPFGGICPICKDVASIVEMPWDTEGMSEGQLSHYLNGEYGTLRCTSCNAFFEWGC